MKAIRHSLITALAGILTTVVAYATHLRGGEITAKRISETSLTYEFTVTIYCDAVGGIQACNAQNQIEYLCFGDGTTGTPPRIGGSVDIGNGTSRNVYKIVHTFPAPGTYKISATIENRNDGVLNMNNSVNTNFYISTTIVINSSVGLNSTPVLLNPAVDFTAAVGQRFIHNPSAFDADGDSLAYRMVVNQKGVGQGFCNGTPVDGYRDPTEIGSGCKSEAGGAPTFSINAITGDLIWDAPCVKGQYNVAFVIEEWRKGPDGRYVKIGEVIRDMQIIVQDALNKRPNIAIPGDTCVEAGTRVVKIIRSTDPDKNRMSLFSEGGVYAYKDTQGNTVAYISPEFATFTTPTQPQADPAFGTFTWQTGCLHVRSTPYTVLFKVEDNPGTVAIPKLVDSKNFKITVVAPKVRNLRATPNLADKTVTLTWDKYTCSTAGFQLVIYRREGTCGAITVNQCSPVVGGGYVEIARVAATEVTYTDNNRGAGLKRNINYSYVIQAVQTTQAGGAGAPSDEVCLSLPSQMPVLTNVTVDTTSATRGVITVKWTRPINLNVSQIKGPYQYRLFRATGLNGTNFAQITSITTALDTKADTIYVDKGLNTQDNPYRYRLDFYYTSSTGTLTRLDTTDAASSVRLTGASGIRAVDLSWVANTPWNNQNQKHRVYREVRNRPGTYNIIAEVAVTTPGTFRYTDTGADTYLADGNNSLAKLSADSSYCYKVETVGTYGDTKIRPSLLFNLSQSICVTPRDTVKPCPPALSLNVTDCSSFQQAVACNQTTFSNILTWTNPAKNSRGDDCDKNIVKYNVYYSNYAEAQFSKIGEVTTPIPPAQTFTHSNLTSLAGCYYVTAVNRNGVESDRSNVVCKDNCPYFRLPNVFTPNGDGKNDTFQPLDCPRFVQSVNFVVFNRWGTKVFEGSGDPLLNWRGVDSGGKELPVGTYYYEAQVLFQRLRKEDQDQTLKGWVEILR
ncbi:MAG: gliding motility-associated C-terminal domain-containing protein [Spirosomataceae bacterium]